MAVVVLPTPPFWFTIAMILAMFEAHVRGGHFVHFDAFGHGIAADERVDEQLKPCDFNAHGAVSVPREFHLLVQRLS
jgi:hypothetical protein